MPRQKETTESGRNRSKERKLQRREPLASSNVMEAPLALFRRMRDEFDRVFDDFGLGRGSVMPALRDLGSNLRDASSGAWGLWYPEVEVLEREGKLVVRADLPGLNKEDVTLEVTDNAIIIEGERRSEQEESREGYFRSERRYGKFRRAIPLAEGVDAENAEATFRNGVLEIALDLPEGAGVRGRQIEIKDSSESQTKPRAQAAGRGR
ncbi:MAG TPA: Hsp20/alpha crystallin family protein [Pyrinomonadaceae bacterium]|nr:Hsp20/alpha crystallin family protein [Pyrinomonadaceae bacterium]